MALTHTISDDETGVNVTVVIDTPDGADRPIIREINFTSADPRGVRAEDLLVLEGLGLRLPRSGDQAMIEALPRDALPEAAPEPAGPPPAPAPRQRQDSATERPPPAAAVKRTRKSPAKKTPAQKAAPAVTAPVVAASGPQSTTDALGRTRRSAPPDYELILDYTRFQGSIKRIAEAHQVPAYKAQGWVGRLRKRNLLPPSTKTNQYTKFDQQELTSNGTSNGNRGDDR